MKKILLIASCFLLFSQGSMGQTNRAPQRTNPLLRFVAGLSGVKEFGLYTLISHRCDTYIVDFNRYPCYQAVRTKIDALDFEMLFNKDMQSAFLYDSADSASYVFLAFKKNFFSLMNDPSTGVFLSSVNQELTKFMLGNRSNVSSLWDLAMNHYRNDYLAARALSALFQDISRAQLHIAYLNYTNYRGNEVFEDNRSTLGMTIETINMILDQNDTLFQNMFYPKAIKNELNRNIYHFYVPLYLAMELKRRGIEERWAFTAPLLLTLTYEFISTTNDYRHAFKDPERLNPNSQNDMWKLRDIFGGYSGANFGVGTPHKTLAIDSVKPAFGRSMREGVSLLLRR